MWVLFLLIPLISAVTDVPIGVIVESRMSNAQGVVDVAIQDIQKSSSNTYNYKKIFDGTGTCSIGPNYLKAGYLLGNFYTYDHIKAVFGPMCYADHRTAGRLANVWDILYFSIWSDQRYDENRKTLVQMSTRSTTNIAENIFAFMRGVDWKRVAVYYCRDCYPSEEEQLTKERIDAITAYLRAKGILITFERKVTKSFTVDDYRQSFEGIEKMARVFLPFIGENMDSYVNLQLAMQVANMSTSEYSTLIVLPDFKRDSISVPRKEDPTLFQNAVVLYNNLNLDAASNKVVNDLISRVNPPSGFEGTYIHLYESMIVFNTLMGASTWSEPQPFSGKAILQNLKGEVQGPFGPSIVFNKQLRRISPFLVYQIVNGTLTELDKIIPLSSSDGKVLCFDSDGQCLQFNTQKLNLNADQPTCGFYGELCDQTGTILIIAAVTTTVFAGVGLLIATRRIKSPNRGSAEPSMPWVIPFAAIRVIDKSRPVADDVSVASLNRNTENNSALQKHEGKLLATFNQQYCIVDRYIQNEKVKFSKEDTQLLFNMKRLSHDNLNSFHGMSFDRSTHLFIVWNHAFRGTLADWILQKKDTRLSHTEKNFRESFVRDLLKGLDYLHSSIGYHGSLTPQQCFIDSRWILKISGYGVSRILFPWKNANIIGTLDGKPLIPNHELHYFAPEIRRKFKSLIYTNRTELLTLSLEEGQAADMYAFGTILYEIIHKKRMVDIDEYIRNEPDDDGFILCEQAEALLPNTTPSKDDIDKEVHNDLKTLMLSCWKVDPNQRSAIAIARKIAEATMKMTGSLVDQMMKNMYMYTKGLESLVRERTAQLEDEQRKADALLSEMLPRTIADDLKKGNQVKARLYKSVTIMYSDIVGFTSLCSESRPMEVVVLLGHLFYNFDSIIREHDAYKGSPGSQFLETIGDAYCVASGIPVENKLKHVANIANIALKQRKYMTEFEIPHRPGMYLHCRWGFNTGPLFTGVIGRRAPRYACFGQTVVIAAKMENLGIPDKIQMTFDSYKLLTTHFPEFICSAREGGAVKLSGIGFLLTFWLEGVEELLKTDREAFVKALEQHESKETSSPYLFKRARTPATASSISSVKPQLTAETSV